MIGANSYLNKPLNSSGARVYNRKNGTILPYIIERRVFKQVKKHLTEKKAEEHEIQYFNSLIIDKCPDELHEFEKTLKTNTIGEAMKLHFLGPKAVYIMKERNV